MTVFNLKMSKENSVTAICWLYYEEYTYYHHFQEDLKRNLIPFYACLTLGTTSVCSFDDVYGTSLLLEKSHYKDMWLHIDSAYAGNALICPEFRYLIQNGIQV